MSRKAFSGLTKTPVQENVPLAPFTTWRVGGAAKWFWEPSLEELPYVLTRCQQLGLPVYYLGRGSNVLIADAGLDGLVICTKRALTSLEQEGDQIIAEAGVPLPKLAKFAASLGFGGYEFLIGIPGTVGAGVAINAGLTAREVRDVASILVSADICTLDGKIMTVSAQDLRLDYRSSAVLRSKNYVLRGRFKLQHRKTAEEIRHKTAMHLADRRRKQPLSKATAGSTFKQPRGGKPAGWYIEHAGLKGHIIGGAKVSEKHANWIENTGSARASDIMALIDHIQAMVARHFDVRLEREVRYLPQESDLWS